MDSLPSASRTDFLLSVVVPCHNEQDSISLLHEELVQALAAVGRYEVILVDDGSTDGTLQLTKALSQKDSRVKYISFSRSFGHQAAIKAGIDASRGDCLVMLDADLQHPPELIPKMIEAWQTGSEVVYTQRNPHAGYPFFKKVTSRLFYQVMAGISDVPIREDSADFRLIDKKVADVLRPMRDNFIFLRGLLPWMGFKSTTLAFTVRQRHSGKTKYSLTKMMSLALNGITSFSIRPLRIASLLGLFISFLAFLYALYAIYAKVFTDTVVPGWTSVLVAVLFIGGMQLIMIGIIGEYLGKLFVQQKDRPTYIVRERNT